MRVNPAAQGGHMDETANGGAEGSKRASIAGWTAGLSAVFLCVTVGNSPEWPVAVAVVAIAAMVGVVCYVILKLK
jgi:hypothetical protein